jgi:hypothetical protein
VRECNNQPAPVWHGTGAEISVFRPYTHFGSRAAAELRVRHRSISEPNYYEVYLSISRPLEITDDEADNHPARLLDRAVQNGILKSSDRSELVEGIGDAIGWATARASSPEEHRVRKWNAGMELLAPRLMTLGYDGFIYDNEQETGRSYVNFRADQVWQVGKTSHDV